VNAQTIWRNADDTEEVTYLGYPIFVSGHDLTVCDRHGRILFTGPYGIPYARRKIREHRRQTPPPTGEENGGVQTNGG